MAMARSPVLLILVCYLLLAGAGTADAIGIKAGGGVLFDPIRPGGHISIEIPISDDRPLALAPFFEIYEKDGEKGMPLGISLLYNAPLTQEVGTIYFGAGAGMLLLRGTTFQQFGGGTVTGGSNNVMATAAGGLLFHVGESFGLFIQGRWFMSLSDTTDDPLDLEFGAPTTRSNFGIVAGIHFGAGE
jgi:hypothetical protein